MKLKTIYFNFDEKKFTKDFKKFREELVDSFGDTTEYVDNLLWSTDRLIDHNEDWNLGDDDEISLNCNTEYGYFDVTFKLEMSDYIALMEELVKKINKARAVIQGLK